MNYISQFATKGLTRSMLIFSGLLFVVFFFGSATSASAQFRGGAGPAAPSGPSGGAQGVEKSIGKQKEMKEYNDRIRDKQKSEPRNGGGGKKGPLDRDILGRDKPIS